MSVRIKKSTQLQCNFVNLGTNLKTLLKIFFVETKRTKKDAVAGINNNKDNIRTSHFRECSDLELELLILEHL